MNEENNNLENNTMINDIDRLDEQEQAKKSNKGPIIAFIVVMIIGTLFVLFMDDIFKKDEPVKEDNTVVEKNETEGNKTTTEDLKVTYDRCVNEFEKLFSKNDYTVYLNTKYDDITNSSAGEDEYHWSKYYAVEDNTQKVFSSHSFTDNDDSEKTNNKDAIVWYFTAIDGEEVDEAPDIRGIFNVKTQNILTGYSDYSCAFHSDEQELPCENVDATMVSKNAGDSVYFGLVSLNDFSTIINVEFNSMVEIEPKAFIVSKNNKYGLYSSEGKVLFKVQYDYLGYNSYFGFIGIIGNSIYIYDNNFKRVDLSNTTVFDLYKTAYEKYENDKKDEDGFDKYLFFEVADSYYWSIGSAMQMHDMSEPFDEEDDGNYRYKYTGSSYSGEQLVINSLCSDDYIYVIKDNKAYKITKKEISKPDTENDGYCF